MSDVIAKCISANPIDHGGILVGSPKADSPLGSNYQINTYSSSSPASGVVISKYDTRFTGLAPCVNDCKHGLEGVGNGAASVLWV